MRTIVARLCMSEDGIVDKPEQWLQLGGPGALDQLLTGTETVVLGRRPSSSTALPSPDWSRPASS